MFELWLIIHLPYISEGVISLIAYSIMCDKINQRRYAYSIYTTHIMSISSILSFFFIHFSQLQTLCGWYWATEFLVLLLFCIQITFQWIASIDIFFDLL